MEGSLSDRSFETLQPLPFASTCQEQNHNNGHKIFLEIGVASVAFMASSFASGDPAQAGFIIVGSAMEPSTDSPRHCR